MFLSRTNNKSKGNQAEDLACEHLIKHKVKILERNFRNRSGEIDIIAMEADTLLFIEVKFRSGQSHGFAVESVTPLKQQKIIRTAEFYLQKNAKLAGNDCRFDVISIDNNKLNWLKNAFDAN